jgi:hypothetical protein
MNPSNIPWWAWLLAAMVLYVFQLGASVRTDKGETWAWVLRILMIVGMVISFLLAIVRFVKWAWKG